MYGFARFQSNSATSATTSATKARRPMPVLRAREVMVEFGTARAGPTGDVVDRLCDCPPAGGFIRPRRPVAPGRGARAEALECEPRAACPAHRPQCDPPGAPP